MSNSNKISKHCCRFEIIEVIESFSTDKNRNDGVLPQYLYCGRDFCFRNLDKVKKYNQQIKERRNIHLKNNRDMDAKLHLITKLELEYINLQKV